MENSFIRKFTNGFMKWCADNSPAARLERSVAQGVLSVVAVGVATGEWGVAAMTAAIVAVLSPLQAVLGESLEDVDGNHIKED